MMKIELKEIIIREVYNGYRNDDEEGVVGYGGTLNIRPKYQREFIYDQPHQEAVINSITNHFPLNVMYWAKNDDGTFEVLDGQQRTISFCEYVDGNFSFNMKYFHSLTDEEQKEILDYKLMVYVCEGTDKEKLNWFRTINIAGEKLTDQELLNAVYAGSWVSYAKRYFSKTRCVAYQIGNKLLNGSAIRQDYLETAIRWISKGNIPIYMSKHQNDANANELWLYFRSIIDWANILFPKYRSEMKGVDWGGLYDSYHNNQYDAKELEKEVKRLMEDSDINNKKGIYTYVFDGNEKHLNIRAFDSNTKRSVYEKQEGNCAVCGKHFEIEEMEADHIIPWSKGGRTTEENCQMLCKDCNRHKSDK